MTQTAIDKKEILEILRAWTPRGGLPSWILKEFPNHKGRTYTARIDDLRKEGYNIISPRAKIGSSWGCIYKLVSEPQSTQPKKPIRYEYQGNTCIPIYQ